MPQAGLGFLRFRFSVGVWVLLLASVAGASLGSPAACQVGTVNPLSLGLLPSCLLCAPLPPRHATCFTGSPPDVAASSGGSGASAMPTPSPQAPPPLRPVPGPSAGGCSSGDDVDPESASPTKRRAFVRLDAAFEDACRRQCAEVDGGDRCGTPASFCVCV